LPIAVTEYNLVAVESGDGRRTMTQAINALFIADTLGQLASAGVQIANQWNLANGTTSSGTDYGMVSAEDDVTFPQYDAMRLWSRAGATLLPVEIDGGDWVRVYPTRREDGSVTTIVLNLGRDPVDLDVEFAGERDVAALRVEHAAAQSLEADRLEVTESTVVSDDGQLAVGIPGWSISVIEADVDV
jgi:hypothetical protein